MLARIHNPPSPAGLTGSADLAFAPRAGRTRLVRARTRAPLLVQRTLHVDDGLPELALVFLANAGAGILEGDSLSVHIEAQAGARVHIATPSATKVFTMGERGAQVATRLTVGAGALLEYLPEPTILFRRARLDQHTDLTVAEGGTLVYADVLAPGRLGHGESLAFTCHRQRLTLRNQDGVPLYHEAFELAPHLRALDRLGVLGHGGEGVLGTLIVAGPGVDVALQKGVRAALAAAGVTAAVQRLPLGDGLVVKLTAPLTAPVRRGIHAAWTAVRLALYGVPALPSRRA